MNEGSNVHGSALQIKANRASELTSDVDQIERHPGAKQDLLGGDAIPGANLEVRAAAEIRTVELRSADECGAQTAPCAEAAKQTMEPFFYALRRKLGLFSRRPWENKVPRRRLMRRVIQEENDDAAAYSGAM
jgi:bacterioferritin-associated ferredoxin